MKKRTTAKVLSLTPEVLRNRTIASKIVLDAADTLAAGGLVILPTETVYSIAVDATNNEAVLRVFEAKQRPLERSMPIMVSDRYMIEEYAELTPLARHLMSRFMPGPLSLIVKQKDGAQLAPSISSGSSVSFRIPGNDFARAIVAELGKPVTTTSANISGQGHLHAADEVRAAFMEKVDMILDQGNLAPVQPSTIVDLIGGPQPIIARQGPISNEEVYKAIREFNAKVVVATV